MGSTAWLELPSMGMRAGEVGEARLGGSGGHLSMFTSDPESSGKGLQSGKLGNMVWFASSCCKLTGG